MSTNPFHYLWVWLFHTKVRMTRLPWTWWWWEWWCTSLVYRLCGVNTLVFIVLNTRFEVGSFLSRFWSFLILVQISILSYFCPDFDPFIFLSRFWSFLYFCPDFDHFFIFLSRFWSFFIFWSRFWSFLYFCPDFDPLKKMLSRFWFFLHLTIYLPLTQFFWRLKYMPVYACQLHVSRGMFKGALAHWSRT